MRAVVPEPPGADRGPPLDHRRGRARRYCSRLVEGLAVGRVVAVLVVEPEDALPVSDLPLEAQHRHELADLLLGRQVRGRGFAVVAVKTRSHLKPSSLRPVETAWRVHVEPTWGKVPVGRVQHSDVQDWVTELAATKSATVVLRAYGVLASILDAAVADRRISTNRARGVKLPRKVSKEHVYLTHQELHDLADASGDRNVLVLVLGYTGLRWGEAIGLRVRDVELERRRINVAVNAVEVGGIIEVGTPKTHKRRSVVFPAFLRPGLESAISGKDRDDLVFADDRGLHLRRTRVSTGSRSWFKTALTTVGLEAMTLHDLRHTAASLAISSGANVKAVQRMLGHASAAMTLDVYADLFDDDLDALADGLDHAARTVVVGRTWAEPPAH
ncbi:tyrosine-type recombinase/integrase [Curtobacterium sp. NPDC092190]|uniref:tyrosine-type recombinase/integrase n=1 Tax=Curtobacterium sp. NPDC092190 TaxID=3363973 RepID=UPI0037F94472